MGSYPSSWRHAFRGLARSPLLTTVAVLTIALSIGLNTAMFSVVDAVVLRPLPFDRPDRLLAFCEHDRDEEVDWCSSSVPDVHDLAERSPAIEVAGVARSWPLMLRTDDGAVGVAGGLATADAFRALGVQPLLGRLFAPEESGDAWSRVVVLSYELWRDRFGGREDILGRSVTVDDEPHTVIGVLPADLRIPLLEKVRLWRPVHVGPTNEERRGWRGFLAYARLRDGATAGQAQAEVREIAAEIQSTHFPEKEGWTVDVRSWQDVVVGSVRRSMYVFAGAVALVLLIGCANVANLLLAQATSRERELAMRTALGANRAHLLRLLLGESLVLASLGALAGIAVGTFASNWFVTLAPAGIPRIEEVALDARVLGFTALLTLVVTVLVGIAPALRATRLDPHQVLIEGGRGGRSRRSRRAGEVLIMTEIALAVILVAGAGLLARSFGTLLAWNPGFEQQRLLTVWTFASPGKFQNRQQVADLIARGEAALAAIPAVSSVGSGSAGPLFGGDGAMDFTLDGRPTPQTGPRQAAEWFDISPGYFPTMGLPITNGRNLGAGDAIGSPNTAIVNQTFARRFFDGDPLGHVVHMTGYDADFTVVGVVKDVPAVHPDRPTPPSIFWSNRQFPRPATYYLVRTAGDPAPVAAAISRALGEADPDLQISDVRSMRDWLDLELVRPRFGVVLLGTFGAMALLLAAVGVYGLLAYTVSERTREIGIQLALGARPAAIVAGVVRRGMLLAGGAVAIGLVGSLGLTRLLRSQLAGVEPTDPLTLLVTVAVLLGASLAASLLPARRASRVDPLVSIRAE
ncbi:MAG: ABC transporter permease [Gemmatimonadales bacterium]